MYNAFYGLREKPFALSPDPRFLYLAESHREALAHLLYGIEQGEGFIAITGEVGTGKTTLCRALLRRLGPEVDVAFLFNPKLTAQELLEAIHVELGIRTEGGRVRELVDGLNRYLLEKRRDGKRVLLIIDEAQGLSPETLEQIRLLSNLETESDKLIQILLLGQPELDEMLASPSLRQLRQRIGVRWRLAPLSPRETREYVRHRLQVAAGEERDLLTEGALREVHRRSGGIPRLVNLICDRALLAGYAEGVDQVGPDLVRRAVQELRGEGRHRRSWLPRLASALALLVLLAAAGLGAAIWWGSFEPGESALARSALPAPEPAPEPPVSAVALAPPIASDVPPVPAGADATAGDGPSAASTSAEEAAAEPEAEAAGGALAPPEPAAPAAPAAPEEPVDLRVALAARSPGAMTADAIDSILGLWGIESTTGEFVSFPEALGRLTAQGFAILPFPRTDLELLRTLDHPTLLRIQAADGVSRVVALRGLTEQRAVLVGVTGRDSLEVPLDELERSWRGEAYVIWRDFEDFREVIRWGTQGPEVMWLQQALVQLGLLPPPATGVFDDATYVAVQRFQSQRRLLPDGAVGPLTKIALYDALDRYAVPRLTRTGETG